VKKEEEWYEVITPQKNFLEFNFKELYDYKDLLKLFVRRDFVSVYKQTILGPLWFFIQPLFTTLIYVVIFGKLAEISSEGIPRPLFYLCGITCWNYFSDCLIKTSTTFTANASIFGKVYFPRLILPISIIFSNLIKFGVQFLLFLAFLTYYVVVVENVEPNLTILIFPLLILLMGGLGLGIGIIISSLTTKYRDLNFLVSFGVQLLMYATPIVYPLSVAKEQLGSYSWVLLVNPMTSVVEAMKYAFLGQGEFNLSYLGYSLVFMLLILFIGIGVFNRVEKTFMDSV
tara:strand:- start:953 stop:1810 length:858 start_codon:yes stop_codon:yes gene_type:complete